MQIPVFKAFISSITRIIDVRRTAFVFRCGGQRIGGYGGTGLVIGLAELAGRMINRLAAAMRGVYAPMLYIEV